MPFSRADPRAVEAIDVISGLDQRPNLLDLSPKEFESFVQNLFTAIGYETDQYRASGDGGIDCMAFKRPGRGGAGRTVPRSRRRHAGRAIQGPPARSSRSRLTGLGMRQVLSCQEHDPPARQACPRRSQPGQLLRSPFRSPSCAATPYSIMPKKLISITALAAGFASLSLLR
jgi:hypothetical protein